jgi:diguanylate cyclase (GGDEF)-like protein
MLLESIEDEVIYIGPDNRIKWLNASARELVDADEGSLCFQALCSRQTPCDDCLLSGNIYGLCRKNFTGDTDKIIAHYSVGENYSEGVLLVFGNKANYSNGLKSDVQSIEDHERLFHEANHDQLTSLYNRRYMDYIFNLIDNNKRKERNTRRALTLLDIDKFKQINDTYGHTVGDEVLKVLAYRVTSEIRKTDIAIRIGGDEFLIVHSQQNREQDILSFINRLVSHMNKPILLEDGRVLKITISMGVLMNAQNYGNLINAMKYADHALYEAKARSANISNYVFFGKDLEKEISYAKELAESLDKAVTHNDLTVYYQPIISLIDKSICGVEAFVRWISEDGDKRYSPTQFLAVAESRNTIIEIGEQLIEQVFEDAQKYQKHLRHYDFISINFSERQFMSENYISMIRKLSKKMDAAVGKFQIEITEEALHNDAIGAKRMADKFRKEGIEIILDNFGKGYSSLSSLLEYNIKKIKIDRHIIAHINENEQYRKLVETLVSISRIHNIEVIAKGIETYEQFEAVEKLGCHYAQGFYICYPQPISKYLKFAKEYYMELNQLKLILPDRPGQEQ